MDTSSCVRSPSAASDRAVLGCRTGAADDLGDRVGDRVGGCLGVVGDGDDGGAGVKGHELHPAGGPGQQAQRRHRHPDDHAARRDAEDLIGVLDDERADQLAALLLDPCGEHALPAAPWRLYSASRVRLPKPPSVTTSNASSRRRCRANGAHRQQLVPVAQPDAHHAAGRAAHRPQRVVVGQEADRLGRPGHQQQVVLALISAAAMSSSSSRRLMAISPLERPLSYSVSASS
jgi:hypothetical protein